GCGPASPGRRRAGSPSGPGSRPEPHPARSERRSRGPDRPTGSGGLEDRVDEGDPARPVGAARGERRPRRDRLGERIELPRVGVGDWAAIDGRLRPAGGPEQPLGHYAQGTDTVETLFRPEDRDAVQPIRDTTTADEVAEGAARETQVDAREELDGV